MRRTISSPATSPRSSWSGTIARRSDIHGLCLILDAGLLRADAEAVAAGAIAAGVRFFQYRNKNGSRRDIYATALRLARLIKAAGALFVVNDHADIALAVNADGVHLGQDDLPLAQARSVLGPDRIIGISTHSVAQARAAEQAGADYIGFGPVFPTGTKDAGPLQGIDVLKQVRASAGLPLIAIGGISEGNIAAVMGAGADGAAVISAVLGASDPDAAAKRLIDQIRDHAVRDHTR